MDPQDLVLIVAVPILVSAGLVIAMYLLVAVSRGVSSVLPRSEPRSAMIPSHDGHDIGHTEAAVEPGIGEGPERTEVAGRDAEPTHRIQVVAQVLFTHLRHDGIFVDTVILEAPGTADGVINLGAPLSLRIERPGPEILGACSEAILELWAERAEVVGIDLRVKGDDVKAELTNGSSRVVLDIAEAAGLA